MIHIYTVVYYMALYVITARVTTHSLLIVVRVLSVTQYVDKYCCRYYFNNILIFQETTLQKINSS